MENPFKAGFVSIVGRPNAGKSTLMNQLVGEKLSIITSKAQTTRHRIMGILNGDNFQIVYSDTPGIINQTQYALHKAMMHFVYSALEDADVILWVIEMQILTEEYKQSMLKLHEKLTSTSTPVILVLNKMDLCKEDDIKEQLAFWEDYIPKTHIFLTSALQGQGTAPLFEKILNLLPYHPAYFPEDELTDKSERFFASEIIREKIFLQYSQEIPYACEVLVEDFKQKGDILYIRTSILVERDGQKGILIGKKGEALKNLGIEARKDLEDFFQQKVFLETRVKVEADWRKKDFLLERFGYRKE
jgi:GTPase